MPRALIATLAIVAGGLLVACPPKPEPGAVPPAEPVAGPEPDLVEPVPAATDAGLVAGRPAGGACGAGAECASGVCEGQGCGAGQAACAPRDRACTFDLRPYCGCDGVTFEASGTCPGRPYAHRGACQPDAAGAAPGPLAVGAPCLAGGDCDSGVCEGQGCGADAPGACVARARRCTRDRRQYCGCDGVTFSGSGSCPGRRYAARGSCPGPD